MSIIFEIVKIFVNSRRVVTKIVINIFGKSNEKNLCMHIDSFDFNL